ncbi:DsbC family protein [Marinimicrobium alkaliphilum]|uniref:DsbC family protein n=1 Tax=Marinimicrobium alkaliphilum TaxID=2202654 RepID=UPI000DB9127F|nr:DsbC family protein [Marinimicrobium alkaliphilum]
MLKVLVTCGLGMGLWILAPLVVAAEPSPEAVITERLQQARPDIEFGTPRPSPIDGLYQVSVTGGPTLYITPDGRRFVLGDMYDVQAGGFTQVQDPYLKEQRSDAVAALDEGDTINFAATGDTKAVIYVFTDVDCGFCRRLHNHINAYNDGGERKPGYADLGIEVRYLAYPRAGVNSESGRKLQTAWCADDRQGTMDQLKNLRPVELTACSDNPVAAQHRLGSEIGVSGTPAILLADGTMIGGYVPPEELARRLGL